jgi:hypothetical protein
VSGVASTIHDSGRVYLFDRNALPKNFIESGMKLTTDGLAAIVGTGSCDIGGKYHELTEATSIAMPQRMTCLLYAAKSDIVDTPTLGYVQAAFPVADANTVCRWIIDGNATIASTVGTNDLAKTGTVTQVDGWIGYGGRGDGSTGYYASANTTGIPTYAQDFHLRLLFTYAYGSGARALYGDGIRTIAFNAGNNISVWNNPGSLTDTGLTCEEGKTYILDFYSKNGSGDLFVSGNKVYSGQSAYTAGTLVAPRIFAYHDGSNKSTNTIHYVEIKNTQPTSAQIAAASNTTLLPCRYYTSETANTYTDVRAVLPVDTISLGRIRTSSTAITEARMEYRDGRREGAWGGNRRVFLGWQAFSGAATLGWENPFGTRKVNTRFVWAQDASGTNEQVADGVWSAGSTYYGIQEVATAAQRLRASTQSGGVCYFGGAWKTSGYIGCYAEVME